jgi:hypothetical protein
MSTRKPCSNISTATYSGKEQSPLRFGLSAEGYELNTILEGYDKMMWAVKLKNGKKVWVRQLANNQRMVHEEPIIQDCNDTTDIPKEPEQQIVVNEPIIMTTKVQEKKITDYNLFLTYKLQELKKNNNNKTNKELFNTAIQEWKELKKNSAELQKLLDTLKKESKFEK